MKTISIVVCLIMSIVLLSPVSAADNEWELFMKKVWKEFPNQKAEIYVETAEVVILIFAIEKAMKRFTFRKDTGKVNSRKFHKLQDSTKDPFHQEPLERLREAVAVYGSM